MASYRMIDKNNWEVSFYCKNYLGENKKYKKSGFKTKKLAKEYSEEFTRKVSGQSDIKLSELVEEYIKSRKGDFRRSTEIINNQYLGYIKEHPIGNLSAKDLELKHYIKFFNEIKDRPTRTKRFRSLLGASLDYGKIHFGLKENYIRSVKNQSKRIVKEKEIWTFEEFMKFDEIFKNSDIKFKKKWRVIFNLLYFTGARCGEISALTLNDIDTKNAIIKINKTRFTDDIVYPPKTLSSIREVTIPNNVNEMLKQYIKYLPNIKTNFIFYSKGNISKTFRYFLREHPELKTITVHSLRHSHVSLLINKGVEITAISKRIGHANSKVTLGVYSHFYKEKEDKIIKILDNL